MKKLIIAVDGTAGSGKSVTFQKVATQLGYQFVDTGLMYRAFTFFGIQQKIDFSDPQQILNLIPGFDYEIHNQRIYLNHQDVTNDLQQTAILKAINQVTILGPVREMMVKKQQKMGQIPGIVMVGRDITSVVLPNADLKIYLDSTVEIRAQRRYEQNQEQKILDSSLIEIKKAIEQRDKIDQNRAIGALKIVAGVWYIDNSVMTIDETVAMVVKKVREMEQQVNE